MMGTIRRGNWSPAALYRLERLWAAGCKVKVIALDLRKSEREVTMMVRESGISAKWPRIHSGIPVHVTIPINAPWPAEPVLTISEKELAAYRAKNRARTVERMTGSMCQSGRPSARMPPATASSWGCSPNTPSPSVPKSWTSSGWASRICGPLWSRGASLLVATMTDATADQAAEPPMTRGELYELQKTLEGALEKHSKTTLLIYLASLTTSRAWYLNGTRQAVAEAQATLLEDLKGWAETGRMVNRGKRSDASLKRTRELLDAIRDGKPLPKPKRKRRNAPKRKRTLDF